MPTRLRPQSFGRKAHRLGALLRLPADEPRMPSLRLSWAHETQIVPGARSENSRIAPQAGLSARLPDLRLAYYTMHTLT